MKYFTVLYMDPKKGNFDMGINTSMGRYKLKDSAVEKPKRNKTGC